MWIAGNIPNRIDVEWVKRGGGIVGDDHPPAYRFNAGQKMIYWIVVLGGAAVGDHRLPADVPVLRRPTSPACSSRRSCTASSRVLFVAAMLGHIYIGTIGMEGAFEAMGTGEVDVNWAQASITASGSSRSRPRTGPNESQRSAGPRPRSRRNRLAPRRPRH